MFLYDRIFQSLFKPCGHGFIRKPLEPERLHLALMRLIEGKMA